MKKTVSLLSVAVLMGAATIQSCKNEKTDPQPTPQPSEFVADNSTFKGFESWHLHTTLNGADPALKGAHGGDDTTSQRKIYLPSSSVDRVDGQFPVGTIISKKTTWFTGSAITAMAKRGNNFDAGGNNWEYFVLNADGSILVDNGMTMRGADLMNGMCKGCHTSAKSKDYIFTK